MRNPSASMDERCRQTTQADAGLRKWLEDTYPDTVYKSTDERDSQGRHWTVRAVLVSPGDTCHTINHKFVNSGRIVVKKEADPQ